MSDVLEDLREAVGHPEMSEFRKCMSAAKSVEEMERVISAALGPSGFVEFARFDLGEVIHKGKTGRQPGVVRIAVGNPLIMRRLVAKVPDAGSYALVTILVDEQEDEVHLSYDRMASLLAPYCNEKASAVARELDATVESLQNAASG